MSYNCMGAYYLTQSGKLVKKFEQKLQQKKFKQSFVIVVIHEKERKDYSLFTYFTRYRQPYILVNAIVDNIVPN